MAKTTRTATILSAAEDNAWVNAFCHAKDALGMNEKDADEYAFKEIGKQFPRLMKYQKLSPQAAGAKRGGKNVAKEFLVTWQIEVDAETPRDAAKQAQEMMRTGDWFFTVWQKGKRGARPVGINLATDPPKRRPTRRGR